MNLLASWAISVLSPTQLSVVVEDYVEDCKLKGGPYFNKTLLMVMPGWLSR